MNFCEIGGVGPDHEEGDKYRWHRRASGRTWVVMFPDPLIPTLAVVQKLAERDRKDENDTSRKDLVDLAPSDAQQKVYDSDNPRIKFFLPIPPEVPLPGEVIIFKATYLQQLYRRRGGVERCIAQMQWRSTITIRYNGPAFDDWVKVSTNFIEEGSQKMEIKKEEAEAAVEVGVTVLPLDPGVNSPPLTVPGDP